jgi:hypothetical protein
MVMKEQAAVPTKHLIFEDTFKVIFLLQIF